MNSTTKQKLAALLAAAVFSAAPAVLWAQTAQEAVEQASSENAADNSQQAQNAAAGSVDADAGEPSAAGEANVNAEASASADDPASAITITEVPEQDAAPGAAQRTPQEAAAHIKSRFEEEFPGLVTDSVKPTRFAGIYELRIGADLLYTNEEVDFVMQGSLIDARNKEDLTAKSLDALMKVAFDSFPLQSAIKQVSGDGSRKMVVFEDPNCGYCKQLHRTLQDMDNYTVYTLLFPILSPDSTVKARNIWCAPDRAQAWRDQMLNNIAAPDGQCETPIESNLDLGRKLLVRGTPAIFFEDGSRVNGALPREALEEKLDEATAAVAGN